jgi:hypothetical protein
MDEKDKCQIIMHEYDTLRAEMLHRQNWMMQAGQIASVALLAIVGWSVSGHYSYVLVLLGLVFLAFFCGNVPGFLERYRIRRRAA